MEEVELWERIDEARLKKLRDIVIFDTDESRIMVHIDSIEWDSEYY